MRCVRRRDAVALVIRDDLHAAVLVDTHARVRGAQVNPDHLGCKSAHPRAIGFLQTLFDDLLS